VGIGLETARVLGARGATVVLACRDVAKGETAADRIATETTTERDRLRIVRLDLASLASVRAAVDEIRVSCPRLDLLVNNAGVMDIPFERSEDGVELTFAVNHLGHFALTGLLLERMLDTPRSRVVTVSSVAHRRGRLDLEMLESDEGYTPGSAYSRSKLANLLFAYELQRRLDAAGAETISLAAHPGIARTELYRTSSGLERTLCSPRACARSPSGSPRARRMAPYRRCAPHSTPRPEAASTTGRTGDANTPAAPCGSSRSRARTTAPRRSGCGRCPRS
jgi:NAD(P)-dependent dehydrogenase (short-subunit alcohol dehydrogenase family)